LGYLLWGTRFGGLSLGDLLWSLGDYYVAIQGVLLYLDSFQGLLLYLDSFQGLLRCFSGIITVPGFFSGIVTTPLICLGIITVLMFDLITVLIFDLITVLIFDLITVLDFRDYSGDPIFGSKKNSIFYPRVYAVYGRVYILLCCWDVGKPLIKLGTISTDS
jgi:hypothetical protein